MPSLQHALQGAQFAGPTASVVPLSTLLVLGAGGTLGSALLGEALVVGRFAQVQAVVEQPVASALRGMVPLPAARMQMGADLGAESALIVFERERHSNGRDAAFLQPEPSELVALALQLRAGGVRRLVVVLPHSPALLPQALRHGLASLDEGAVAGLGFEHLVFVRAAQHVRSIAHGSWLQRLANWWLAQLRYMVPQQEQPVRAQALARCVVQLLRLLPASAPGTRVLAPETLWHAAQNEAGLEAAVRAWLMPGSR
ncbi:MAG TPA: hypothetical protein VK570_16085 [Rubrivivax sp.]|nr:hypothetical protein [Rubrivivax sp.]